MHFYIEGHKCILIFELTPPKMPNFYLQNQLFYHIPPKKNINGLK